MEAGISVKADPLPTTKPKRGMNEMEVKIIAIPKLKLGGISRDRMIDMLESLDGTTPEECFSMICFMLSLIYRGSLKYPEPGIKLMTIMEFTDKIGLQVRKMIDNPPEGFEETPPTPGCDCDTCSEKRARLSSAH
jgi:hypothetical protein